MEVDEARPAFAGQGFGQHRFAAPGRAVEEDARRGSEEGGVAGVEVGESKRVYHCFAEVVDYRLQPADIRKGDGDVGGAHDFHCYSLLVFVEFEIFDTILFSSTRTSFPASSSAMFVI